MILFKLDIITFECGLKTAKSRFDSGVGEKYDVTQAEVSLANEKPPLIRARLEHSIARHDLELSSIMLKRATGSTIIKTGE